MVTIGGRPLTLEDFNSVLFTNQQIDLSSSALEKVDACFRFLKEFSKDKVIYGINTGFGPMAQYRIDDKDQIRLQYNLIRSHCSGTGNALPASYVRSVMLARLNSLALGYSGISPSTLQLLTKLINEDICPVIFEHGSVGASGDLVQLAHLALGLIGEGKVHFKGEMLPANEVLSLKNISPLEIQTREGLAVMNGTSCMTGIGIINILQAYKLLSWSVFCSSIINEIVQSYDDHFSAELNSVKLHHGQNVIAQAIRRITEGSSLIRKRAAHLYDKKVEDQYFTDKVQEYYSLRCVPQVLGPIFDTILYAERILMQEVNSVNDNPVVDVNNGNVFHGGNFHGDYVALEMDKLKTAITKLSMLAERQLNYLLNDKLNNILPPFVNLGTLGLNFGIQGMQFTATSTVAENQTLSFPMYVHSIPNNNDNQDIVSMGSNAALMTKKVIENTFEVLSIQMITILQAVDYLGFQEKLSPFSKEIYYQLRKIVPKFENDSPKFQEIQLMKEHLLQNRLNIFHT